jgi:hypothetical protein
MHILEAIGNTPIMADSGLKYLSTDVYRRT